MSSVDYEHYDNVGGSITNDLLANILEKMDNPTPTPGETPNLQAVTDKGNSTDKSIVAKPAELDEELATLGQVATLINEIPTPATPNLQAVTDKGNSTNKSIIAKPAESDEELATLGQVTQLINEIPAPIIETAWKEPVNEVRGEGTLPFGKPAGYRIASYSSGRAIISTSDGANNWEGVFLKDSDTFRCLTENGALYKVLSNTFVKDTQAQSLQQVTDIGNTTDKTITAAPAQNAAQLATLGQAEALAGHINSYKSTVALFMEMIFTTSSYVKITDNADITIGSDFINEKIDTNIVLTIKASGKFVFPTQTLPAMPSGQFREVSIFKDFEGLAQITYYDLNVIEI